MQISPDFLTKIVEENNETLAQYYNDKLYESLIYQNRSHLLVTPLQKAVL